MEEEMPYDPDSVRYDSDDDFEATLPCAVCGKPIIRSNVHKNGWKHTTGFACCIFPSYRDENGKLTIATPS